MAEAPRPVVVRVTTDEGRTVLDDAKVEGSDLLGIRRADARPMRIDFRAIRALQILTDDDGSKTATTVAIVLASVAGAAVLAAILVAALAGAL